MDSTKCKPPLGAGVCEAPSAKGAHALCALVSCDHVASVRHTSVDFRDQIQFKRAELPELWAKVQLFKDRLAASGKMYVCALRQDASSCSPLL